MTNIEGATKNLGGKGMQRYETFKVEFSLNICRNTLGAMLDTDYIQQTKPWVWHRAHYR